MIRISKGGNICNIVAEINILNVHFQCETKLINHKDIPILLKVLIILQLTVSMHGLFSKPYCVVEVQMTLYRRQ